MLPKTKGFWILLATILGSSMALIDGSVVNVALPRIQADLNATAASMQWIVEAYALFLGSLILVGGSMGDLYGRKRLFAIGIAIFALASIWCGLTTDITQLVVARAVQGIGGALLTPESLAILRAFFDETQRGKAIGLWSAFSAITAALGPVLGGWLVQYASWRWIFFINLPLALIVLIVLVVFVPESRNEQANRHLDIAGACLATLGLGLLVFGLIEASTYGIFHPLVLGCVAAGVLALVGFIFVERRSPAPMMPLQLFKSRVFSGTNLLTFFLYGALGATLYFLPFNLIRVQGYSATAAGSALLPFTLLVFSLSRWSGGLVARYGARLPLIIGPLIAGIGYILFAIPGIGGSYWTTYFPAVVVLGLGMAVTVAPLTTTVMGAASDQYAGTASGVNNAVARVANLLAIAVFTLIVLATFNIALDNNLAAHHVSAAASHALDAQRSRLTGAEVPTNFDQVTREILQQVISDSFLFSFRIAMLIGSGLAFISALCATVMIPPRSKLKPEHEKKERQCGDNACTLMYAHRDVDLAPGVDGSAGKADD
ncbi:MFS transporter [Dictyobacter formicarum]|uniref:MFS transporter n=1 Tax=Dictyobacter formicarum TaxID=2778368 RepID=A0ABQ3VEA7_9CHLR|nr:MFS transporter [Dictyobacter formicarum]GHO83476.1 MFS transporter [Dictyobacter formicarum]